MRRTGILILAGIYDMEAEVGKKCPPRTGATSPLDNEEAGEEIKADYGDEELEDMTDSSSRENKKAEASLISE